MSTSRHKTTIEIGVDDRQIAGLEKTLGRTFDVRAAEQYERSVERIATSMERIAKAGGGGALVGGGGGGGGGSGGGGGAPSPPRGGGAGDPMLQAIRERDVLVQQRKDAQEDRRRGGKLSIGQMLNVAGGNMIASGAQRIGGAASAMPSGNFLQAALSAIPVFGGMLGGAASATIGLYNEHAQQQMGQAGAFGATGIGRRGMNSLVRQGVGGYGLQPGQIPGLVSQFAGASGLVGDDLAGAFGTQLQLQQMMGVGSAGALVGAAGTAGGTVADPSKLMRDAVASGLGLGIRETRLDQYLQNVSGFVEDARSRGIALDPSAALQLFGAFQGSSFQGEAGARFAGSFGEGFGRAGQGSGFAHGLALRAAGFGSEGGPGYQGALELIESRDPATMSRFVDMIRQQTSDPAAGAYIMRQAMGQLGVEIGATQSRQLFENGMVLASAGEEQYQSVMDRRKNDSAGIFAEGRQVGGMALKRQAMGAEHAGTATSLMNLELEIQNEALQGLQPAIRAGIAFAREGLAAYQEGGARGFLRWLTGLEIPEIPTPRTVMDAHNEAAANNAATRERNIASSRIQATRLERSVLINAAASEGVAVRLPGDGSNPHVGLDADQTAIHRARYAMVEQGMPEDEARALQFSLMDAAEAAGRWADASERVDLTTDLNAVGRD